MKQNVIISLVSSCTDENGNVSPSELVTVGTFEKMSDGYIIAYKESQITGLGNTDTTILVNPDTVTLTRTGDFTYRLIFPANKEKARMQNVFLSGLHMTIVTEKVSSALSDDGGFIAVKYCITSGGQTITKNNFSLKIKPFQQK